MRLIVCMIREISKDAESIRSGILSHVSSESALFSHQGGKGGLLSRAQNMQPDIWDTHGTSVNVFASSPRSSSTKNSFNPMVGRKFKNYGVDQQ